MPKISTYMAQHIDEYTDQTTGEVNESALAEAACEEFGVALDPEDGSAPDNIWKQAYRLAYMQETKTGARPQRIRSELGDLTNHVDSNFNFPKIGAH